MLPDWARTRRPIASYWKLSARGPSTPAAGVICRETRRLRSSYVWTMTVPRGSTVRVGLPAPSYWNVAWVSSG